MSFATAIKDFAYEIGYSKVGITTSHVFEQYVQELNGRYAMFEYYITSGRHPIKAADPKYDFPSAKSIITVVYDYFKQRFPDALVGKIARLYQSKSILPPYRHVDAVQRELMKEFLERNGCHVFSESAIPARLSAARAGIASYGKNTFVFIDGIGSFVAITSFLVDVELAYDEPTVEMKCSPKCTACIDACPTGALYEPLKINPRRCITFNTSKSQDGGAGGVTSYILPEIREKMGTWIHGCDVCQQVCPRNQKKLKLQLPPNDDLEMIGQEFRLTELVNMSHDYFAEKVLPFTVNYIHEKKYFQRNAAIALGNTRDRASIPYLAKALKDPEPIVRSYAAWALGKIGGNRAKKTLENSLSNETDDTTRKEIQAAITIV